MADDGSYGRLPEDIFALIQALQRRERWAWDILEDVVRGMTHKHYAPLPTLGIALDDLVHEVMKELLKPSVLADFHGPQAPSGGQPPRQGTQATTRARPGSGHHPDGKASVPDSLLIKSFLAYLRIIIRNTRHHMIQRNLRHLGAIPATPEYPPAPGEHPGTPPNADSRPTLIVPVGPDALASHPSADPPTLDIVIIWERFDLMCARVGELRSRGEPWPARVDWLLRSSIHGDTYDEIAQEYDVERNHVRDRIGEIRVLLRHDRALYDMGELPPDLFLPTIDQSEPARGMTPSSSPFFQPGREHINLYLVTSQTPEQNQSSSIIERDDEDDQDNLRKGEIR